MSARLRPSVHGIGAAVFVSCCAPFLAFAEAGARGPYTTWYNQRKAEVDWLFCWMANIASLPKPRRFPGAAFQALVG